MTLKELLKGNSYQIFTLILFILCITMGSWGLNSVPALAPTLQEVLGMNPKTLGVFMSSFYLGTSIMAFLYSFYFDKFKIKTSLTIGLLLIGSFISIVGLWIDSINIYLTIFLVTIAGTGYGIINPAINKGITTWFPAGIRGTAMSLKQVGVMFGSMLSAAILPTVALNTSISFTFVFTGAVIIMVAALTYAFYKEKKNEQTEKVAYSQEDRKIATIKILKDKNILLCNIVSMLFVGAQFSYIMYVSLYFRTVFEFSIVHAGLILSLASLGGIIGRVLWGGLSDYFRERKLVLIIIGFASFIFCLIVAWIPVSTPNILLYIIIVTYGMTIGGWNGVLQAMVVGLGDVRLSGIISGFTLSFIYFSTFIIPMLFGLFIEWTEFYRMGWSLSAITILFGTLLLFKVREKI